MNTCSHSTLKQNQDHLSPGAESNGVTRMAKVTVSDTMEQETAPSLANVTGFINALSVALWSIMCRRSTLENSFSIVMPFWH